MNLTVLGHSLDLVRDGWNGRAALKSTRVGATLLALSQTPSLMLG